MRHTLTISFSSAAEYADARSDEGRFVVELWIKPLGVMVDVTDRNSQMADQRLVKWIEIEYAFNNQIIMTIDDLIKDFPMQN